MRASPTACWARLHHQLDRRRQRHFGYKLFAGYDFNRFFALEGGYFDPGRFGYLAGTTPAGQLRGNMRLNGVNLDALGFLPFTPKFSAFGRFGVNYAKVRDSFVGTGAVNALTPDRNQRDANYNFGFGLQYGFTSFFAMRAEAERFRINDPVGPNGDVDLYSIGLLYKFGRHAPAPIVAAPPPRPGARGRGSSASAACPGASRRCSRRRSSRPYAHSGIAASWTCSSTSTKPTCCCRNQEKLNVAGTFLKKYPQNTAVIEGYTDDVGTDEANMKLSQRRADSVARYLIDRFQLAPPGS